LLSGLQPSDDISLTKQISEEDEVYRKMRDRKVSMNEQNVIGMNFQKYNESKPNQEVRVSIIS
jgi:hypothetical protein